MIKIARLIRHLFIPHESNNHKAKILHSSSLFVLVIFLVLGQILIQIVPRSGVRVLGFAANISPEEVVRLTNEKRAQAGLTQLTINPTLSAAARAKGADMLAKGYWAHVAPDGTTPWKFFVNSGYKYKYAGENLARDFSNASSAVDAWMASPSHKENMLSNKYREIGIGVVEGNLAGVDTTIVVQFFGSKFSDSQPTAPVAKATVKPKPTNIPAKTLPESTAENQVLVVNSPQATNTPIPEQQTIAKAVTSSPQAREVKVLVSPFNTTKNVSLIIVGLLLVVLVVDGVITSRRRIARIGGRTFAHIAFLGMIMAIVLILKAGKVL